MDVAGTDPDRLRAEAVAMLYEQAALCSAAQAPAPAALPVVPPAGPAPATGPAAPSGPVPVGADTAALLRELRSLGEDPPSLPLPPPAAAADVPGPDPVPDPPALRVRRGVFRRTRSG